MSISISNDYLLVMPSGNVKGFNDYEFAKGYINNYYYYRTRDNKKVAAYDDLTNDYDDIVDTVCYQMGTEEGECKLYYTNDVIEKLQNSLVFDDEKEEVISKLLQPKIEFNTYDYAINDILNDLQPIDIMERYGDQLTGQ